MQWAGIEPPHSIYCWLGLKNNSEFLHRIPCIWKRKKFRKQFILVAVAMRNELLIQIVTSKHIPFESYNVKFAHPIEVFKAEKKCVKFNVRRIWCKQVEWLWDIASFTLTFKHYERRECRRMVYLFLLPIVLHCIIYFPLLHYCFPLCDALVWAKMCFVSLFKFLSS